MNVKIFGVLLKLIRYYQLEDGRLQPSKDFQVDKVTWIDLTQPNDTELIEISQRFNINMEDLEDCLDDTERPRFNYDRLLKNHFILLRTIQNFEIDFKAGPTFPLGIFFTQNEKILTIHGTLSKTFESVIDKITRKKITSNWFLILEILHSFIEHMDHAANNIAEKIRDLQNRMLTTQESAAIHEPFRMNSVLIFFNTAMLGNSNAIKAFYHKNMSILEGNLPLSEKFDEIQTDIDQVYAFTSIYRDLLVNMIDAYASVINNNLSTVMKVSGSISLILMIPTMIASYYGMNVVLPGGVNPGSDFSTFYLILILSLSISTMIWYYFRKARWL
jgi:magnesium transporter